MRVLLLAALLLVGCAKAEPCVCTPQPAFDSDDYWYCAQGGYLNDAPDCEPRQ